MSIWEKYSKGKCFIIAEAGISHFGSLKKAYQLVDMAVEANVDAVKFQIFNIEKLFTNDEIEWKERLGPRALSVSEYRKVKDYCDEKNIKFFATAHDDDSLDELINMGVDLLKVGSGEVGNHIYLKKIIDSNIPSIISTGMYSQEQLVDLVDMIGDNYNKVSLLHCVTEYPTPLARVNLSRMLYLKNIYRGEIGYSDHTDGMMASTTAVSIGAKIIEKHISLDFNVPNAQDWKVSLNAMQLCDFVKNIREIELLRECYNEELDYIGNSDLSLTLEQKNNLKWASKSAIYKSNMVKGEILNLNDLEFKRPGTGMNYKLVNEFIGKTLKQDVTSGDKVSRKDFL